MKLIRALNRRVGLLARFAVISLVLLAAIGLALGNRLQASHTERTLASAVRSAEVAANMGVKPQLTVADLERDFVPLDAARTAQLDATFGSALSGDGIVRLEVWNRQHWIVFSDNAELVGRWSPADDQLAGALTGRTVSSVTDLLAKSETAENPSGELLRVTVPLRADGDSFTADGRGDVVGALDVYLPYRPIAGAIADDTRTLALTIAVGFGVVYLVLLRLIASASSRLRRQSDETMFQANHDPLTGLPNRRSLLAWMAERLPLARPHGAAMALIDLDRFKEINDTLGHVHGDELLRRVGRRLRDAFDSETMVARLGGDEYAVVAMREGSGGEAVDLANRVSRALARPMLIDGVEIAVRASVGLAVAPDDGDDAETLLQRADMAMYVAKQTNSRYRRFEPALDVYSPERFRLAADVRRAMDAGEFFLTYQPKVSFADRSVHGVEALVRWRHPERGIINPTEFLPVIENTELIGPLTYHLLDLALGQAAEWHRMGLDVPVAVNLSARTLLDPELPARLNAALSRFAVPPSVLELELTESAVLADPDEASVALGVLKQLGFSLAVDDFGTGTRRWPT